MGRYKEYEKYNKPKRETIIIGYSMIIVIIIIIIIGLIATHSREDTTNTKTHYKEVSDIDYKVYLKDNDFFESNYIEKGNQYIASLIDYIDANFSYELEAIDGEKKSHMYTYSIEAVIDVTEKSSHNVIYTSKEELIPETKKEVEEENLKIDENIKINYTKYNELISQFVNIYDLDNSESTITINMYVNIEDEERREEPVMLLEIPLTTKTIAIDIVSNTIYENNDDVTQNVQEKKAIYLSIFLGIINVILIIKLIIFIFNTQNEKKIYKMKIKKILSNYGSYIQKIANEFDFEGYQTIELKSFEKLLQIRDIVQAPILMIERQEEAYFMVPTQSKLIYMFELNSGDTKKRISEMNEDIEIETI